MASAVVELNQQNDSRLPRPTRLHAPIDSVPVQNLCDDKDREVARKCNHFSIRGYVSEVRKRDPKLCYPFPLDDSTDLSQALPPMVVPKFRWWRCIGCVPEANNDLLNDSCGVDPPETQNGVNADDSNLVVGKSSNFVNNGTRVRNSEASTSTDSNDNKNYSSISNKHPDRKGKGKTHVVTNEIPPSSGCKNGFGLGFSGQRTLQQNTSQIEVQQPADSQFEPRSRINQNGSTKLEALHKDSRADKTKVGPSEGYVTREVNYATKIDPREPHTSSQHQRADLPNDGVEARIAGIVTGSRSHTQGLVHLPDLNECSGEASYEVHNETTATGNIFDPFCEDDDDYLGAERQKKPKVRFLSELLGLKECQNPGKGKKKTPSSGTSQDDHAKRKRVGSQDEGLKSKETRGTDDGKKNAGTSEISESECGSDSDAVSTDKISQALAKRRCKDPLLEKRNKKTKVDHGDSSLSRQKIKPKSTQEKGKPPEELPRGIDIFGHLSETNSVMTKKRGKVSQARKEPSTLNPSKSQMPKECGNTQKEGEAVQNATENVQKPSESDHHLLSTVSSNPDKNNDHLCLPKKNGFYPSPSQAEQMLASNNRIHKDEQERNIGETSLTLRTTAVGAPFIGNLDAYRDSSSTKSSSEKKTESPEVDRCSHLVQFIPMKADSREQMKLTNEIRGRIQDIDINSIPIDDKTNEQGPGDDIPMDIVELMAKNQYERRLDDPTDKLNFSRPPALSGTYVRPSGTYGSHGQPMQNFPPSHFLSLQGPQSTDPRISMLNDNLGQHSYYNRNHLGVRGLSNENPGSKFLSPNQGQEHVLPYSARSLPSNSWRASMNAAVAQRHPSSFFQAVGTYQNIRACAPRQSSAETSRVWPSGTASRMPLGITNPQMISQSSNVLNKARIQHQSSGSFLNFSAGSNLDKQQNLNFSKAYNNGNLESSSRSGDINEAIPAMHLLSLMQNAAKLQSTELSLGPQKVVKPVSSRYPFSKNTNRTSGMKDGPSHPCYPTALPTARPFPLSYQNDSGNIGRFSAGFMGPIPLTLRGQRNMESSHFAPSSGQRNIGSSHFAPSSEQQRPVRRPMAPPQDKGKTVALPKPSYINNPFPGFKDSPDLQCGAGVRSKEKIVPTAPDKVICQLNQNPSEFNDLKLMSQYMIGPEDLKPRKRAGDRAPRPRGNSKRQEIGISNPILSPVAAVKS